jgi:hypothetical protein
MDYNSEGTYLDKDSLVVYNEQAQIVYGLITFILIILIILTLLTTLKLKSIFKNL